VGASVSTDVGATMAMSVSTEMGVTTSTIAPTITAPMMKPKMGTFVPSFTAGVPVSTSIPASPNPQVRDRFDDRDLNMQNFSKDEPYGIQTSMMENLHNNHVFIGHENPFTPFNTHSPSSFSIFGINAPPALTTKSMMLFTQQMDKSNHKMVSLLTQQIGTMFNPLIQSTHESYQALATQMGRIADFFAPPQTVYQRIPQILNIPQIQNTQPVQIVEHVFQRQQLVPQHQPVEPMIPAQQGVILVNRNHDADEVVWNVQQQNIGAHNNIAKLVEKIMVNKSYIPFINNSSTTNYVNKNGRGKTFVPHAKAPEQKWVHLRHKNVQYGKNNAMKGSTSNIVTRNVRTDTENPNDSRKYAYRNNYKGKRPMTRSQWRRYQRSKKGIAASVDDKAVDPKGKEKLVETVRRPVKERLSMLPVGENPIGDGETDSDFLDSEPNFDVVCNVVSILSVEYDVVSKLKNQKMILQSRGHGEI